MIQSKRINGVDVSYTIADPKIDDIYAAFKVGATVKELGQSQKADVAANLNYANNISGTPIGRVIVDGKTVISDIPKTVPRDELYMLADKSLHIGKAPKGALWALQGSPPLLKSGKNVVVDGIKRDELGRDIWANNAKHYRVAHGITADRKLVIARTKQVVTLDVLTAIMTALGCVDALNGDGGGSTYLWPDDNVWGRKMGAALMIKKGDVEQVDKPLIIIDPGHGGTDPGASGNGIAEKLMTLSISLYQYNRFKELGLSVAITRTNDISIDPTPRATLVKNSGAKYCISNHINAAVSADAAGAEIIHSIHNDGKLAIAIANSIRDTGQVLRKTPVYSKANNGGDYYFMHRQTGAVTTLIVEYGFCTNATDATRIKANWQTYAEAVVKSFCLFVGHKYTAPKETVPAKPTETIDGFTDIKGHWALSSIQKMIKTGKMSGVTADRFGPDEPLSRAQFAVLIDRLGLLEGGEK